MADPARTAVLDCHLWCLPPNKEHRQQLCEEGLGLLCDAELERYRNISNPNAASRFLLGRCLLRHGLAQHLGVAPEELSFSISTHGKPVLQHPDAEGLCFNLAHSREEAVVAIARCDRLGVDLEPQSRGAAALRIATHMFPHAERRLISSHSRGAEYAALTHWVIKESVAKAIGCGVGDALTSVCIECRGPELDWLLPPPAGHVNSWTLMAGLFRQHHVLALALQAHNRWHEKAIQIHSHVLGTDENSSILFSPITKTRNTTTY